MTCGVLLYANNNEKIDYVKQALWSAQHIKQHLGCSVAVATDSYDYLKSFTEYKTLIDHIIELDNTSTIDQTKKYRDGTMADHRLTWKNTHRHKSYDITPFDQTIVLDTDVIISNDLYKNCWNQPEDFLIDQHPIDLHPDRQDETFTRISDKSIDFYWATAFYFRKTDFTRMLFDMIAHVQDNWTYYRTMYQISQSKLRNDFVFSIAIHILNGFKYNSDWPKSMPSHMFFITDNDILYDYNNNKFTVMLDKITHPGEYTINTVKDINLHVMNKFSLDRIVQKNV